MKELVFKFLKELSFWTKFLDFNSNPCRCSCCHIIQDSNWHAWLSCSRGILLLTWRRWNSTWIFYVAGVFFCWLNFLLVKHWVYSAEQKSGVQCMCKTKVIYSLMSDRWPLLCMLTFSLLATVEVCSTLDPMRKMMKRQTLYMKPLISGWMKNARKEGKFLKSTSQVNVEPRVIPFRNHLSPTLISHEESSKILWTYKTAYLYCA